MMDRNVRGQRYQPSSDISRRNRGRAASRSRGVWFFQTQFKTHHEIDPLFLIAGNRGYHRRHLAFRQSVLAKNFGHLFNFYVGEFNRLAVFAVEFRSVMLRIGLSREISAQTHGDRACRNFRQSSRHHNSGRRDRAGESRRERERNGQPVRHADHDVAYCRRGREMLLNVFD